MKPSTAIILLTALTGHSVAAPTGNAALQAQQPDTNALRLLATHISTGELTQSNRVLLNHLLAAASSLQKRGADSADSTDAADGFFSDIGGGIGAGLGGLLDGVYDIVNQILTRLLSGGIGGSASAHVGNNGGLNLGGSVGISAGSNGGNLSSLTGAVPGLQLQNISLPAGVSSLPINVTTLPGSISLPGNVIPLPANISLPGNTISLPTNISLPINITGTTGSVGSVVGGSGNLNDAISGIFRSLVGGLNDSVLQSLITIITNAKGNPQKATNDIIQFATSNGYDSNRIFQALQNVLSLGNFRENVGDLLKGSGGLLGGLINALEGLPSSGSLGPIDLSTLNSQPLSTGALNTTVGGLPSGVLGGLNITIGNLTTTAGTAIDGANGGITLPGGLTLAELQHLIDFIHGATDQQSVTNEVRRVAALHNLDPVALARLLQSLIYGNGTTVSTGVVPIPSLNGTTGGVTVNLNGTVGGLTGTLPGINGTLGGLGGLGGLGIGLVTGSNLLGTLVSDASGLLNFLLHLLGLGGIASLGSLGALGSTLGSVTTGLNSTLNGVVPGLGSTTGSILTGLNSTLPGLVPNLTSGLASTVGSTVGNLGSVLSGVGHTAPSVGVNLTLSAGTNSPLAGLVSALSGVASSATGLGNGVLNATGLGSVLPGVGLSSGGGNGTLGLGIHLKAVQSSDAFENNTALDSDPSGDDGDDDDDEGSSRSYDRRSRIARFRASVRSANAGIAA